MLVTGGNNQVFRIWNCEDSTLPAKSVFKDGPAEDMYFLSMHPNGNVGLTGGKDNMLWMFDSGNGKFLSCFMGHEDEVLHGMFTRADKGKTVVSSSADCSVKVWAPIKQ